MIDYDAEFITSPLSFCKIQKLMKKANRDSKSDIKRHFAVIVLRNNKGDKLPLIMDQWKYQACIEKYSQTIEGKTHTIWLVYTRMFISGHSRIQI